MNQYWYSQHSIDCFVAEIEAHIENTPENAHRSIALISCPSIYFSLTEKARERCLVLDIDKQWKQDPGFVGFLNLWGPNWDDY